ncbi:MAG: glycosyltransferase family 4 protein [Cytophagales bacterium]|nr:glycosyltransferase family 4 protein [Cytophagales bacterium]
MPTTIDTENLHNRLKEQDTRAFVIGWTGTHSTIAYLEPLVPILEKLAETHAFTFLVISDRKPDFDLPFVQYLPWQKATEADDLLRINVGVMPLTDDPWSRGKCGFKALQYMALGIPAVASPVGVNTEIIEPGVNGFLCATPDEWLACLTRLLQDPTLRAEMGRQARRTVEERYSVQANRRTFLELFDFFRTA